jgi:hypothetical protein
VVEPVAYFDQAFVYIFERNGTVTETRRGRVKKSPNVAYGQRRENCPENPPIELPHVAPPKEDLFSGTACGGK